MAKAEKSKYAVCKFCPFLGNPYYYNGKPPCGDEEKQICDKRFGSAESWQDFFTESDRHRPNVGKPRR